MAYHLVIGETLGVGLRRVVREQAAKAAELLRADGCDPLAAAHEARRRGKEVRAALRLLRDDLLPARYAELRAAVRAATRPLAAARDAEAALEAWKDLLRHYRPTHRIRMPAEAALIAARDAARDALTADQLRASAALFDFCARQVVDPAGETLDLDAVLERLYRRGRRRMREASQAGTPEAFHAWRRDAKDLWYAVQLLEGGWEGPLVAFADELHQLGRRLGRDHDLTVLRNTLASRQADPPLLGGRLPHAIARRQASLRKEALAIGRRAWQERPPAFAARLVGYWESAREEASD